MKYVYVLKIDCNNNQSDAITRILGVEPTKSSSRRWEYEILQEGDSDYIDFIDIFLDKLSDKYNELEQAGIPRDSIGIWIYYEYDQQCNLEFSSDDLKKIGNNGISLCISCWQK